MPNLKARILGSFLGERLLRVTRAHAVQDLGPRFRRVTLHAAWAAEAGDAFGAAGQKVQIFHPEVGARTYTPFDFDRTTGLFSLLVHVHGDTPGATWGRTVRIGDEVRLIGPQPSTPLDELAGPVALFGDETSFAVARTLLTGGGNAGPRERCTVRLELASRDEAFPVADALEIPREALVAKEPEETHLAPIARQLVSAAPPGTGTVVLTGRAISIQKVREHLRELGHRKQTVRAYWADGKRGLD